MDKAILFKTVLLIEDETAHAVLIKRVLQGFCSKIVEARDFNQALELLKNIKPDLIISDLNLPDKQGASVVSRLLEFTKVPIIVLTSSTSLHDAVNAMQAGAKDFIVKQFEGNFKEVVGLSLSRVCASWLLEQERREIERQMEALHVAMSSSQDGLALVEQDGQISYSNQAFSNFADLCAGQVSNIYAVIGANVIQQQNLIDNIRERVNTLSAGAVWSTEVSFQSSDGSSQSRQLERSFDLSLTVVNPELSKSAKDKASNLYVFWVRDSSERKRRERFQREILSTTTHDLKGPLATIYLCAEMLGEMVNDPEKVHDSKVPELVLRVASSSRGALNLIDEFLSARRIESGNLIVKPLPHDIGQLVDEILNDYRAQAAAKRIQLSFDVIGQDREVSVDKLALTRIIGNLVGNAIKFTPKQGQVKLQARVEGANLIISVSDSGNGIAASEIQGLFERYKRLEQHQGIEGTGLGLFVVKSIVTASAGSIEVTSQPGMGTVFTVRLPRRPLVNERGEVVLEGQTS